MGPFVIFLAQSAVPAEVPPAPPPDIELRAHVDVRSVEVRSQGQARIEFHAEPGEAPPVVVERSAPAGRASYRNLRIDLTAFARLSEPERMTAIKTTTGDAQ